MQSSLRVPNRDARKSVPETDAPRAVGRAFAWLLLLASSLPTCCIAQESAVRLDGRTVMRVGEDAERDSNRRARSIEARLAGVLTERGALSPARVSSSRDGSWVVTVAGRPIVTVTARDAEENGTEPRALAVQWAAAIDQHLARAGLRRGSPAARLWAGIRGSIETAFARLLESTVVLLPRFIATVLVIAFFWAIASSLRWIMRLIFRRFVEDLTTENLIRQVAYYSVWVIGLVVAADAFGVEPTTLVAGLGITGLALGFALKDVLSNFVSGLLILSMRPFELGDQIRVGDTEGKVERIQLRATQIRTYDGRVVLVPNAELFTSRVTNNTAAPVRRAAVTFFLGYDVDLRIAAAVAQRCALEVEGVLEEPAPTTRINELGRDEIELDVRFWTDSRRSDYVATCSAVREALVHGFLANGIALPNPDLRVLAPSDSRAWSIPSSTNASARDDSARTR